MVINTSPVQTTKIIHFYKHMSPGVTMSHKVNSICRKSSILFIFLLFFQVLTAQYDFSEAEAILEKNRKALGNDVVMLIWKDGKMVYAKDIKKGETGFNVKTPAPIASCSKWLTAALVMTFVDAGKISLDDPISKYLPFYEKYMKGYITIRQCLSHTTGIEDEGSFIKKVIQRSKFNTLEEEVNAFASKREIAANPGKQFWYGNVGLNIAGRILEIVGKKSFDRLMMERLFRPLKMKNSTFTNENYNAAVNPSGGAKSTANDYMNFLSMILNKGMFEGKRFLSEESVAEMMKIQTKDAVVKYTPVVASGYSYGLGCWIQEMDGSGNATVISSPGLFGTWPMVDYCRGYTCIIFVKTLLNEQRKEIYLEIKEAIDRQISAQCK
jgi:CubicO group peptidase (beta-lactamase class C family)